MSSLNKEIHILPYDPSWPIQFEKEAGLLKKILGEHCLKIHHIGSTSVPGLSAKQDIDMMCIIDSLSNSLILQDSGFIFKGELNIPLRYFFSKNTVESKVNLHVVEPGHPFVNLNLSFRDYLRSHDNAREAYQALKEQLIQEPNAHQKLAKKQFTGYNLGKNDFIKDILNKTGLDEFGINFCMHPKEWEVYHRIRDNLIFRRNNRIYDRNHPSLTDPNNYHLVLYKGTHIIGVAQVEFLSQTECALRPFAIDTPYQHQGYGRQFLEFIETWLRHHRMEVIHVHAHVTAQDFYRKQGYIEMPFEDLSISIDIVDMGKHL